MLGRPGKNKEGTELDNEKKVMKYMLFAKEFVLEFLRFLRLNSYRNVLSGRKKSVDQPLTHVLLDSTFCVP